MTQPNMSAEEIESLWLQAQVTPTEELSPGETAVRIVLSARAMPDIKDALDIAVNLINAQRSQAVAEYKKDILERAQLQMDADIDKFAPACLVQEIYRAFGWQGGTIHQILAEIKRLRAGEEVVMAALAVNKAWSTIAHAANIRTDNDRQEAIDRACFGLHQAVEAYQKKGEDKV